jgi:hypothetical protein
MTFSTPKNYLNPYKRLLFAGFINFITGLTFVNAQSIYKSDFEQSEGYTQGILNGQVGWVSGNLITIDTVAPYSGSQLVWLAQNESNTENRVSRAFDSVLNDSVIYLSFYMSQSAASSFQDLPKTEDQSIAALSGLINRGNGLGEWVVSDGDGLGNGAWRSTGKFIRLEDNAVPEYLWYVYRLDYKHHVYDFFVDGVLVAGNVAFINSSLTNLDQFGIDADGKQDVYFDKFTLSYDMPVALDHDRDGLLTTIEDVNGNGIVDASETDFMSSDTDDDAMGDATERMHGFNPLVADEYGILQDNGSGELVWETGFEASEVFNVGDLNGQFLWQADGMVKVVAHTSHQGARSIELAPNTAPFESVAQHYFGTDGMAQVWVSFYGKLSAGVLPDASVLNTAVAGIFKLDAAGNPAAFDSYQDKWLVEDTLFDSGYLSDGGWKHYVVHLDYLHRQWTLIAEGGIVFRNIPFDRETPGEFSYFKVRQLNTEPASLPAYIDQLVVSDTEPEGLDFDFDGITNQDERDFSDSMGLDLHEPDSNGNLTKDGMDDFDGDDIDNASEFARGRLPDFQDADVDLYVDVVLGDDNSYNGLSALPGRPTLADGPKSSIASTFAAAEDSDVILLQSGIFNETSLNPNNKNLTLRTNGPVTIR